MRILNKETEEQSISDKSKYEVTAKELDTYKRKANDKDMQLIRDQNMCTRVKDRYSKGIYLDSEHQMSIICIEYFHF